MKQRLTFAVAVLASTAALGGLVIACGGDDDASAFGADGGEGDGSSDASSAFGDAAVGAVSGVVLLHAAAFPAFRLCFENYPDLAPQPDIALMPQSNVVGVEVGSVVRLGSFSEAPGKVYVIRQTDVRATPRDTAQPSCGQLLANSEFTIDLQYQVAGSIDKPLGVGHVDLLAITGCGGGAFINALGISKYDCADDWDPTSGSLRARTIELLPTKVATPDRLPVQLVQMSNLLDNERAAGQMLEVSFGPVDAGPRRDLPVPALFAAGESADLIVDQASEPYFGSHGFRISLRPPPSIDPDAGDVDGGAADSGPFDTTPTFTVEQSLAEIQELSSPQTLPTSYYLAASNYALLLLGDPRVRRTFADGGVNAGFDARRAVHLLAVPVKSEEDAGSPVVPNSDASVIPRTGDGG